MSFRLIFNTLICIIVSFITLMLVLATINRSFTLISGGISLFTIYSSSGIALGGLAFNIVVTLVLFFITRAAYRYSKYYWTVRKL